MLPDPIITEIRNIREQIAAEFNYDLHAMVKDATPPGIGWSFAENLVLRSSSPALRRRRPDSRKTAFSGRLQAKVAAGRPGKAVLPASGRQIMNALSLRERRHS